MSRNGTLLPIPEGSDLERTMQRYLAAWPDLYDGKRSAWLSAVEMNLRGFYPQSSSADRKLTARHYAPFPLALGPDVP